MGLSLPFYLPYDVTADKHGDAWAVTEFSDSVFGSIPRPDSSPVT